MKPNLIKNVSASGDYSYWELIDMESGKILWTEKDINKGINEEIVVLGICLSIIEKSICLSVKIWEKFKK